MADEAKIVESLNSLNSEISIQDRWDSLGSFYYLLSPNSVEKRTEIEELFGDREHYDIEDSEVEVNLVSENPDKGRYSSYIPVTRNTIVIRRKPGETVRQGSGLNPLIGCVTLFILAGLINTLYLILK